jgi:rhodanese-related sulfurtransferase
MGLPLQEELTMPISIDRHVVQQLTAQSAQIVEVLPASAYDELHLPGAISLPLHKMDASAADRLRRDRAVIVYCYDSQ